METLAAIPFVLVVGAVAWQLGLVGYTAWQSAHAARAAARAEVVGEDGEAAARSVLPSALEERAGGGGRRGGRRSGCGAHAGPVPRLGVIGPDLGQLVPRERAVTGGGEHGQASVELLGGLPAVLLLGLVILQALAVGYSAVLAGNAAEAGALALAAGQDPRTGVREALPDLARERFRVDVSRDSVQVRLRPPSLVESLGERLEVTAAAGVDR